MYINIVAKSYKERKLTRHRNTPAHVKREQMVLSIITL